MNQANILNRAPMMMEPVTSPEAGSSNPTKEIVEEDTFYRGPKFPVKLSELLADAEKFGYEDTVSWLHHGKSFKVHKPVEFVRKIAPTRFCLTKYKSFQRQVSTVVLFSHLSSLVFNLPADRKRLSIALSSAGIVWFC
jgi:hypothetical protein